jgi:hypothetical protein
MSAIASRRKQGEPVHTGLLLHIFRGKFFSVAGESFKTDAIFVDEFLIIRVGLNQVPAYSPHQRAIGAGSGACNEISPFGGLIQSGIYDNQLGAFSLGFDNLPHIGGMAGGEIGAPEDREIRMFKLGVRIPEPVDQPEPQVAAVKAGRIIGHVIGRSKSVDKASGVIFFLEVPDRLPFPDAHGPGPVGLPDLCNLFGNFIQSLFPGNFRKRAIRHFLKGL